MDQDARVRLQCAVDADVATWIREAASLEGKSVAAFLAAAALFRADQILGSSREYVTTLPPDEFDRLVASLDEPPRVIPALQRAFAALAALDLTDLE